MAETKTIIICPKCKGLGYREWDELTDYHKRDYRTHRDPCTMCDSQGRVYEVVTTKFEKLPHESKV